MDVSVIWDYFLYKVMYKGSMVIKFRYSNVKPFSLYKKKNDEAEENNTKNCYFF